MNIMNIDSGGGRTLTDTASGEVTLPPSRTLKTENPPRWPLSRHRAFGMIGALHSGVHRSGEGDDAEMVIGEAPTLSFSKSRVAASEEARRSSRAKEEFSMIGALSRTYSKRVKKPRGPEMVRPRFPPILDKQTHSSNVFFSFRSSHAVCPFPLNALLLLVSDSVCAPCPTV